MLDSLLDGLADLPAAVLPLAAFALAFAETALFLDLIIPGEVGLVLVGAATADADGPVPVPVVVAVGAVGAMAGDCCSFALGRAIGRGRVTRPAWIVDRARHLAESAEGFFERRGGLAVFAGRFVGALRAAVPFVAGASGMRFATFLAWNAAASLAWVGLVVGLGARFGRSVADTIDRLGAWVSLIGVALVVVVLLVRRWRSARSSGSAPAAASR